MNTYPTVKKIVYKDWNTMISRTQDDVEFLDRVEIKYSYYINLVDEGIEVVFETWN